MLSYHSPANAFIGNFGIFPNPHNQVLLPDVLTMPAIKASANLPSLVKQRFAKALAANELFFFPTQVTILHVNSIPVGPSEYTLTAEPALTLGDQFQLRFSPALANKPKAPPADPAQKKAFFDPFANPPAALFVADLEPSHFLVLNKFAVVPEHFILATKENKPQTHVLEEADLEATLACIRAYEVARTTASQGDENNLSASHGLYAFFNCGKHSGASQPHRHIQLLPVAKMREGLDTDSEWSVLADRLGKTQGPFLTFSEPISLETSAKDLHETYLRLYRQACRAVKGSSSSEPAPAEGETLISYNLAMTKDTMVVCPRLAEGAELVDEGEKVGSLALNGTLLAGTALVKSEREWDALRQSPSKLLDVLNRIGIPQTQDKTR